MTRPKYYLPLRTKGGESSSSPKNCISVVIVATLCLVSLSFGANVELSHDLQSLISSKILMDRTSSVLVPSTVENLAKVVTRATSTAPLRLAENKILSNAGYRDDAGAPYNTNNAKSSSEPSSLRVAHCRATCLEKFIDGLTASKPPSPTTTTVSPPPPRLDWNDDVDELQLLPKIMRLRKRRFASKEIKPSIESSNEMSRNCKKDSPGCISCWNACQLFEAGASKSNPEVASTVPPSTSSTSTSSPVYSFKSGVNEVAGTNAKQINFPRKWFNRLSQQEELRKTSKRKESQTKHNNYYSQLSCISEDCDAGCQVACAFYEKLFAKNGGNEGSLSWNTVMTRDPVVATKPGSSATKIVPGKISWLSSSAKNVEAKAESQKNDYDTRKMIKTSPVVYTVIPEFPARKWRQIAQTTEESSMKFVSSSSSAPNENDNIHESDINKGKNSGKKLVAASQAGITALSEQDHKENSSDGDGSVTEKPAVVVEADYITPESVPDNVNSGGNESVMNANASPASDSGIPTSLGGPTDSSAADKEFNLKVVSLIHRNSLVIAELKWNDIGGDARKDYLITWELKGGGLKGHLVTDSTTVTLSLWPDTSYKIQVEQFQLDLDTDGPVDVESTSSSIKSEPLIVDTSEASHPLEKSSAHYTSEGNAEYDYQFHQDSEYYSNGGNEKGAQDKEALAHKSIKGLHNMTLILVITLCATILVLVILLATAFSWTRFQTWRKAGRLSCFNTSGKEPHLLASQEDISSSDDILGCTVVHSFHSPMDFVVGLKKQKLFQRSFRSSHPEKLAGLDSEVPVAVISSSSSIPAPYSRLHGYVENEWSNQSEVFVPTSISSVSIGTSCSEKVPFCSSSPYQQQ